MIIPVPFPLRPPRGPLAEVFGPLQPSEALFGLHGPGDCSPSPVAFPGRADYSTTVPPAAPPERQPPTTVPTFVSHGPPDPAALPIAARLVVDLDEPTLAYLAAEAVMRGRPLRALVAAALTEIAACRMLSAVLDSTEEGGS